MAEEEEEQYSSAHLQRPSSFVEVSRVSRQFRASFALVSHQFRASFAQFRVVRVVSSGFTCCFTVLFHRFRIGFAQFHIFFDHFQPVSHNVKL